MHPTLSVPAYICSYFQCLSSQSNFIPIPLFLLPFSLLDIVFTALILISIESSKCSLSECFYSIITSEKMTKLKEITLQSFLCYVIHRLSYVAAPHLPHVFRAIFLLTQSTVVVVSLCLFAHTNFPS